MPLLLLQLITINKRIVKCVSKIGNKHSIAMYSLHFRESWVNVEPTSKLLNAVDMYRQRDITACTEDFEIKTCCPACLYHVEIRALQAIAWMDGNQLRHKETSAMTRQLNSVQAKLQTILWLAKGPYFYKYYRNSWSIFWFKK